LRKNEWVEGIEERFGFVKVSVADVRVSRLFQPWQLQRSFFASGGHVTNGISTTLPLSIGT
jgi:hypothetical protein